MKWNETVFALIVALMSWMGQVTRDSLRKPDHEGRFAMAHSDFGIIPELTGTMAKRARRRASSSLAHSPSSICRWSATSPYIWGYGLPSRLRQRRQPLARRPQRHPRAA